MSENSIICLLILGVVEGLTEFIPVSSTAHLLIISKMMGIKSPGDSFIILVQLGAVAALLYVYFSRIITIIKSIPYDPYARHFSICLCIGVIPSAILGFLAHDFIKSVLFKENTTMCISLIMGGIILLIVDRVNLKAKYFDAQKYPISLAFRIGLFQCLSMIPGTSRSGATIVGSLILGADKRSAIDFSFFLAMPTIIGACLLDFYRNSTIIINDIGVGIIIGCFASFISGLIVVRFLLNFMSKQGYTLFAIWRIVVGSIGLLLG
ncbi:undecaprenyl-diphosphate phosphatase [Candidatus Liberibacter americanus]|uniref:undecaprenyl-diphosphate phosphatase n=1 Tax=Candidatus Liberibacter americanus TaxID=309868 RepID=UPI000588EFA4|nr:undecaprenyl-diphosphate phosphatase [Candidatus Liberibacter americanus]